MPFGDDYREMVFECHLHSSDHFEWCAGSSLGMQPPWDSSVISACTTPYRSLSSTGRILHLIRTMQIVWIYLPQPASVPLKQESPCLPFVKTHQVSIAIGLLWAIFGKTYLSSALACGIWVSLTILYIPVIGELVLRWCSLEVFEAVDCHWRNPG